MAAFWHVAMAVAVAEALAGCRDDNAASDDFLSTCAALDDDGSGSDVTVRIENARDEDVFLVADVPCLETIPPTVIRVDTLFPRPDERSYPAPAFGTWPRTTCDITCEDLREGRAETCAEACGTVAPVRLTPGGVFDNVWPGVLRTPSWIPEECLPADADFLAGVCEIEVAAQEGLYVARAREANIDPSDAAAHSCDPNADGWCVTTYPPGYSSSGHAYAMFEYPSTTVEVIFQ